MKLWLVTLGSKHVILSALDREYAKTRAQQILRSGNPDNYIVTPLTEHGDAVYLDVKLDLRLSEQQFG